MGKKKSVKIRSFSIIASLLMIFSLLTPSFANAESSRVIHDSEVNSQKEKVSNRLLSDFENNEKVTFLVKFKDKADTTTAVQKAADKAEKQNLSAFQSKLTKRSAQLAGLKTVAQQSQQTVMHYLAQEKKKGNVEKVNEYFIINGLAVTATKEVAQQIATYEEVEKILKNETRQLFTPIKQSAPTNNPAEIENVEWNIERVKAPNVWDMGIDGSGVVVASIDSGVQWDHPALKEKYRGYNTETEEVNHDFNWFDATANQTTPYDDNGHGTHTVGTMVGSEPDGTNQIGVAPGAKWIAVKAFTKDGGTDEDLLAAAEWILAPTDAEGNTRVDMAPDIVNNSWGGGPGLDEWYRDVVIEWRNADIFPQFSAGNVTSSNRGGPESVVSPANYPESFATGATDIGNDVATFSLRGPSPYGEIKPDISAPGQVIRSSIPGGSYYANSGTSMAGPAVSGVAALLRSVNATISVDEMEEIILGTAIPLTDEDYPESPNNGYGYGLIDAYGAVSAVTEGVGTVEGTVTKTNEIPLNAHISIEGHDRSVNTNPDDGTYSLKYAGGEYTLVAEAYGYTTKEENVTIERDETTTVDFTLDEIPQATISGTLTNKSTGEPIQNATLLLKEDANITPVKTDDKGQYELTAFEGTYTVKITARGFKGTEVELTIDGNQTNTNYELTPFYSFTEDEIAYDDGSGEGASRFKDPGHGWAVKMSLAPGEETAMVTGGKFLINVRTSDQFQIELMDASGPNGSPGKKIAGPIDATASSSGWTTVDLRDEGIIVDGDFYMVYIQTEDSTTSTSLQQDKSDPFLSRSWEMYSGYWYQLESSFLVGNKMIRALVDYELDQPIITSPKNEEITNNEAVIIEGTAPANATVKIINNSEEAGSGTAKADGSFAIPAKLTEGKNKLKAIATLDDKITGESNPIIVTLNTETPTIEKLTPTTDQYVGPGDEVIVSFESNVTGGKANFEVKLPAELQTQSASETNMEEVTPGKYEGTWTVPSATELQGATIEVKIADDAGNKTTAETTGKLFVSQESINRLENDNRYTTAIEISKKGWAKSDTIVLTRGDNYADALAGVPYAYQLNAPILLSLTNDIYDETVAEITRLGAKKVVILGGESAISAVVAGELKAAGLTVDRISGSDRFETAAKIASKMSSSDKVVIANGKDFPDALSVAAHAANEGLPILLTQNDKLPAKTSEALETLGATETIVVGGTTVVSEKVVNQLPNPTTLAGDDRYETNIKIAEYFDVTSKHIYIATGQNYADALTGAVLAAKNNSAVVLVHKNVPESVATYITDLDIKRLTIFGGESAVSKKVANDLKQLIQ